MYVVVVVVVKRNGGETAFSKRLAKGLQITPGESSIGHTPKHTEMTNPFRFVIHLGHSHFGLQAFGQSSLIAASDRGGRRARGPMERVRLLKRCLLIDAIGDGRGGSINQHRLGLSTGACCT